jgi:hypothetical protein
MSSASTLAIDGHAARESKDPSARKERGPQDDSAFLAIRGGAKGLELEARSCAPLPCRTFLCFCSINIQASIKSN